MGEENVSLRCMPEETVTRSNNKMLCGEENAFYTN
jgi:hypothetical protein